jgi:hypothetical protein
MSQFIVRDTDRGNERPVKSRAEAEEVKADLEELGADVEIIPPNTGENQTASADGGPDVVETQADESPTENIEPDTEQFGDALAELGESLETDPLDVLPGYMITHVDGKPSLNKRGVSVLAYHYDISVLDREVVAYPHENDFTTAVVEITVKDGDGREFVGVGESHVDETPKHQLLRMSETRAYKRAVIFATGTGIVGYQELMEELE